MRVNIYRLYAWEVWRSDSIYVTNSYFQFAQNTVSVSPTLAHSGTAEPHSRTHIKKHNNEKQHTHTQLLWLYEQIHATKTKITWNIERYMTFIWFNPVIYKLNTHRTSCTHTIFLWPLVLQVQSRMTSDSEVWEVDLDMCKLIF